MAIENTSAIFGECKWRNEPIDKAVLDKMITKTELFGYEKNIFICFQKVVLPKDVENGQKNAKM